MRVLFCLLLAGCAHKATSGFLLLRVEPPDARVLLDDRYIGSAAQLSGHLLKIDAGMRRIEVEAEGRYAARREADVKPQGQVQMTIELPKIPDGMRD